jgi:Protein of unknown function (DUF2846).
VRNIYVFLIFIICAGCTSGPSKGALFSMHEEPGKDSAIIYFYISEKEFGSTACTIVTVDEEERGCIGSPGFVKVVLSPGEHNFSFRPDALLDLKVEMRKFSAAVEGEKVYYLESRKIETEEEREEAWQSNYVNALGGFTVAWLPVEEPLALEHLKELRAWQ